MADATDTKATGGSSKRTAAIATIITLVVLALVGGGLAYGLHARQEQEAQQAREKAVAAAQTECDRSIDRLTQTRGRLAKQVTDGRTQNALKLTDSQVADPKTLRTLKQETSDRYTVQSCKTTNITLLKKRTTANRSTLKRINAQSKRLTAAVTGVEKSKAAKDEADRKAAEAKQRAEEAAMTAQPQQEAQPRQQPSGSGSGQRSYQTGGYRSNSQHHAQSNPTARNHSNPIPSQPGTPRGGDTQRQNNSTSHSGDDWMNADDGDGSLWAW